MREAIIVNFQCEEKQKIGVDGGHSKGTREPDEKPDFGCVCSKFDVPPPWFQVEQEKRMLEQQLSIETRRHEECEMKLKRTRQDLTDLKSRMFRAEQDHRDESRRNRLKMKDMQERFSDETQTLKYKV